MLPIVRALPANLSCSVLFSITQQQPLVFLETLLVLPISMLELACVSAGFFSLLPDVLLHLLLLVQAQVTLWNTGEDAYQHDRLGNFFTIERIIKLSGAQQNPTTKWKVLDHVGREFRKQEGN